MNKSLNKLDFSSSTYQINEIPSKGQEIDNSPSTLKISDESPITIKQNQIEKIFSPSFIEKLNKKYPSQKSSLLTQFNKKLNLSLRDSDAPKRKKTLSIEKIKKEKCFNQPKKLKKVSIQEDNNSYVFI